MQPSLLSLLAGALVLLIHDASLAQNVCADYVRNVPREYGPRDPWEVGVVLRNQMGHGGLFYNCDCEEHKRMSPYIRWERQPTVCCPHGHCWWVRQQIDEVRQRIRTGACLQSEFCLCPQCRSSEPPITPTCPSGCGGEGCPTCTMAPTSGEVTSDSLPASPDRSNPWMSRLYEQK